VIRHLLTAYFCGVCGLYGLAAASPPDAGQAIDAWLAARTAVDAGDAATLVGTHTGLQGVRVVLRVSGRPLAAASAASASGDAQPLLAATRSLIAQARRDGALADLPPDLVVEGLGRTTLELDAAGDFTPMTAATLADAATDLAPAADGVALRVGDTWHLRFPSALRMSGAAATLETLGELAAVAGLTPDALDAARRSGGATLYRFQTITLVQCPGEMMPRAYERGRDSTPWRTDRQAVITQLNLIGQHLLTHCWEDPDGGPLHLGGTYDPPQDRCQPVQAAARDQAFAALALQRLTEVPGVSPELVLSSRLTAASLAGQLSEDDPVLLAVQSTFDPTTNLESVRLLLADEHAPRVERAIAAWTLADTAQDREAVTALLDETASGPRRQLLHMLPWIGWADLRQAESLGQPPRLDRLWQGLSSVTLDTIDSDSVTADMLAVAAFLASVQPTSDGVSSVHRSLQLLDMLVVSPHESKFFRSPERAAGGVRLAPWNERMPVWAQTMGILLLCEAIEHLQEPPTKEPTS
jgi:hypothetical protein